MEILSEVQYCTSLIDNSCAAALCKRFAIKQLKPPNGGLRP